MSRAVRAGEVWSTFIFDGVDCADLGVYAISNSSTYTTNLEPTFSDKKTSVTAFDGQYYYGTQITGQKFTFNMFAESRLSPDLLVGYRSDVSMTLSLDLIDLLEQLTELKTLCLLVYQFIVKRIGLGNNEMEE